MKVMYISRFYRDNIIDQLEREIEAFPSILFSST